MSFFRRHCFYTARKSLIVKQLNIRHANFSAMIDWIKMDGDHFCKSPFFQSILFSLLLNFEKEILACWGLVLDNNLFDMVFRQLSTFVLTVQWKSLVFKLPIEETLAAKMKVTGQAPFSRGPIGLCLRTYKRKQKFISKCISLLTMCIVNSMNLTCEIALADSKTNWNVTSG